MIIVLNDFFPPLCFRPVRPSPPPHLSHPLSAGEGDPSRPGQEGEGAALPGGPANGGSADLSAGPVKGDLAGEVPSTGSLTSW